MKKNILIALLSFIIGNLFGGYDFCDRTILVTLEPEYSHYTGALEASFFGSFEKDSVENIFQIHNEAAINALNSRSPGQFRSIYLITLPRNDKAKVLEAIDELNTIEGIQSAKPNYITTPTLIPNDEYWHYTSLWNLHGTHGIKAPEAWNVSTGSHNVRVGVIDTGISSHPDLNANVDTQSGWNFAENNDSWIDTHGHGTKTAGILGAVGNNHIGIVGVNWNVTMVPMKIVFGSNGQSHEDHMVKAVEWATNLWGTENEIPILTMSYSGYGFILDLQTAISNFPGLFIWSAGNHGSNLDNFSKIHDFSSLPNLIAVGAIDMNGNRSVWGKESSAYSATNQHVHIYAPGSLGFSTSVNNTYSGYSGTSMAAPHVAGVAALLLSVNPTLSASSLKNIVLDSADNIQISIHNNPNHTVRRLNAHSAILSVVEITVYDIEAESISGPLEVIFNDTLEFTVSVVNTGSAAIYSHEYTTHLMRGGLTIASSHGVDLAPGKSHDFVFNWTPSTYGFYQLNGHVNYSLDQVPSNNTTSNMSVTVQTDFLAISTQGPYNIPNAIRLIAPGGRLELAGGWYNYPDKLSLKNKDFHLIGTGDESYPTTLTAWFEIENVTSEAKIENIIFTPNWNKHFESILR
ncbi:MAG: S8 family serine peptidase, partial [Candidatus Cloacimonetes bacterium]|nr:S8 family serine peptidase [Candidatus Cloacimonadota bacterium]